VALNMDFVHYDLGSLDRGQIVEVSLNIAANVQLLDTANFNQYRSGGSFQYVGGRINRSPARLSVPTPGHWHLAIDLGGASGNLRSEVRVLGGRAIGQGQ
jgi:Domain of unknown function (DUF1883)